MPCAWANRAAWTVLDTDFQDGRHFFSTWLDWQRDPQRSRILHYVGIARAAPSLLQFGGGRLSSERPQGWQALIEQCKDLGSGFHRMLMDGARVSLTLCIGDVRTQLSEHVFQADAVFTLAPADKWAAQLLARRCKRGTRLSLRLETVAQADAIQPAHSDAMALLQSVGFEWDEVPADPCTVTGAFNPRWTIPTTRTATPHTVQLPARCAVVGAGIAGASVAHALAVRGWDVTVFDRALAPAGGASGMPVGLAVPHVSVDDNPRARLSRSGTRLLAQHADRFLVRGLDWDPCGVIECRPNGGTLVHASACWIKPARLVQAWLAHPAVHFMANTTIADLQPGNGLWQLKDRKGLDLGQFEVVVLANAIDSAALLKKLPTNAPLGQAMQCTLGHLQAVHGTLSFGGYARHIPGLPGTPVNGHGCFIPHVPGSDGDRWFAGSTFETDAESAADSQAQHALNMAQLQQLLPVNGTDWIHLLSQAPVGQWSSTRCVTHDRLPLVGPVDTGPCTGLWLCTGMGSRGLSFSSLCAELLAARLCGEPLPVESSLSRSLDAGRARRRSSANTGV